MAFKMTFTFFCLINSPLLCGYYKERRKDIICYAELPMFCLSILFSSCVPCSSSFFIFIFLKKSGVLFKGFVVNLIVFIMEYLHIKTYV